jgi:hypothetical protein
VILEGRETGNDPALDAEGRDLVGDDLFGVGDDLEDVVVDACLLCICWCSAPVRLLPVLSCVATCVLISSPPA